MQNHVKFKEKIPKKGSYDVIVAGGGIAGVAAAVAAAREGASVLLIEKTITLGGLATSGLVNLFVPMCNGRGVQIIKGMAEEFLRLSVKYGYDTIPAEWKNGQPKTPTDTRYITRFSAPVYALALAELIKNEGVNILLDTFISSVTVRDKKIKGLICDSKSGREFYSADIYVDTTGDADVLYRAGVPTVTGRNFFTYYGFGADKNTVKKAHETGEIKYLFKHVFGGEATLHGTNQPEGEKLYEGVTNTEITEYMIKNQLRALDKIKQNDRESSDLIVAPTIPQFRTTRRIDGEYTLTEADKYRRFEDSVSAICDFDNRDFLYEVPYRTLVKKGWSNVITAGRSASASGFAWDVLRVIPPAIVTGQASGTAAAMASKSKTDINDVDIKTLQSKLEKNGIMLHFDDALIPKTKNSSDGGGAEGHI